MRPSSRLVRWAAAVLGLCAAHGALAAAAPWPDVPFKYFARDYSLSRVLQDFANAFGIALDLSPKLDGKVVGNYSAATPTQFLDALASRYGFNWYYQAGELHVTKALEWITVPLHVGTVGANVGALKSELTSLGVFDARFGWAEFPERGIVMVSGPESYVKEISSIVSALGTAPSDGREIRLFRLQYARAEDYTFSYDGQEVVTPGVATLLRNLAAGSMAEQQAGPSTGPLSVAPSAPVAPLPSLPLQPSLTGLPAPAAAVPGAGANPDPAAPSEARTPTASESNARVSVHAGLDVLTPVIEADPRLNAVLVYDAPEKMPIYAALIHQLDAGRPQIQIEAMIVDVDTDAVDTLGVAWEAHASGASVGFGDRNRDSPATVLSINTDSFLARVHALATKGQARILGRPSVLTVDNLVAVLSLSETVYARVSGSGGGRGGSVGEGGLVPITTGTLLRVIPRLVQEGNQRDVSLAVQIEDGQLHYESDDRDVPPSVIESSINTQAVIHEDDSLLIGGYFMDSDTDEQHRVPGLSSIPLLGRMFRDSHTEHKRSERLFIIRPHIVTTPAAGATGF